MPDVATVDTPIVIPVTTSAVRPDIMLSHLLYAISSPARLWTHLLVFVDRLLHNLRDFPLKLAA